MQEDSMGDQGRAEPAVAVSGLAKEFRTPWGRKVKPIKDVSLNVAPGRSSVSWDPTGRGSRPP